MAFSPDGTGQSVSSIDNLARTSTDFGALGQILYPYIPKILGSALMSSARGSRRRRRNCSSAAPG